MTLDRLLRDLDWRPGLRATKSLAYFQLVDACGKPGCPVCRCLREGTFRSLDALLYEQVTDPATRGVLERVVGVLCLARPDGDRGQRTPPSGWESSSDTEG